MLVEDEDFRRCERELGFNVNGLTYMVDTSSTYRLSVNILSFSFSRKNILSLSSALNSYSILHHQDRDKCMRQNLEIMHRWTWRGNVCTRHLHTISVLLRMYERFCWDVNPIVQIISILETQTASNGPASLASLRRNISSCRSPRFLHLFQKLQTSIIVYIYV